MQAIWRNSKQNAMLFKFTGWHLRGSYSSFHQNRVTPTAHLVIMLQKTSTITLHEVLLNQKCVFMQPIEMCWAIQGRLGFLAATLPSGLKNSTSAAQHCGSVPGFQLKFLIGRKAEQGCALSWRFCTDSFKVAVWKSYVLEKILIF